MCIRTVTFTCRKGHYFSEQPPEGIQSKTGWCYPCSDGSFMDFEEHNERHCIPCRTCTGAPNEYYKRRCDRVTNSECALCPPGQQAAPEGRCLSPTTTSSAKPTTTSASTTNSEITVNAASTTSAASSETKNVTTSSESTHSQWSQLLQAFTIRSGNEGPGLTLQRISNWHVHHQKNASASQEDGDSSSVTTSTDFSSTVVVDKSLTATTSFAMTVNDIPMDAKVTSLAVVSVTSTVALFTLVALWLKRRDRERRGSRAELCCCSFRPSHVYEEPVDYDVSYLKPPQYGDSGSSSASSSTASDGNHTYDYPQPYGSFRLNGNSGENSSLLSGARGSLGERLSFQIPASEIEERLCGETGFTLRSSPAAFCRFLPSEVTHLGCVIEPVLNDARCNSNSHYTEKSATGCGDSFTKCGQPPLCHKTIVQHADNIACDKIYAEIE